MAVSGSTDFSVNRDQLINDSLELIGAKAPNEPMTNNELQGASRTLNMMLKSWQTDGLQLWLRRSLSLVLIDGTSKYTLGPGGATAVGRPLRVLKAMRKDTSDNEVEVFQYTQDEYLEQTPKNTEGTPVSYYYDPQLTNGNLHVWPTPGSTEASEYTLEITYHKPTDDMDSATDDFEFPQEWLETIKYGLALKLAPVYGLPIEDRKQLYYEFKPMKDKLDAWDQESGSIYFQPDRYHR
jgi:hypothetical protein